MEDLVRKSGVQEGLCLVNAMHITASVFINDAEMGFCMIMMFGWRDWHRTHPRRNTSTAAPARTIPTHMKRQVMGREVVIAITKGKLDFGLWEQIFYGVFDGRRRKRALVKIIGE